MLWHVVVFNQPNNKHISKAINTEKYSAKSLYAKNECIQSEVPLSNT